MLNGFSLCFRIEYSMFENLNFPISLDEDRFDAWLTEGRESPIRYDYLVVLWDEMEKDFRPVYVSNRQEMNNYLDDPSKVSVVFVAGYDLFSESKIL